MYCTYMYIYTTVDLTFQLKKSQGDHIRKKARIERMVLKPYPHPHPWICMYMYIYIYIYTAQIQK